jgi:ATP-dependent RNA/DNA helicase IGHMBP2
MLNYSEGPALSLRAALLGQKPLELVTKCGGKAAAEAYTPPPLPVVFNQGLDESQRAAVAFALSTDDVALIHGPPGTGKTTTLVELLLHAVCLHNLRVLLVAPSNVAVDNLLERLVVAAQDLPSKVRLGGGAGADGDGGGSYTAVGKVRAVRLGHPARLSAPVLRHSLEAQLANAEGTAIVEDVRTELRQAQIRASRQRSKGKGGVGRGYGGGGDGGGNDRWAARRECGELRKEVVKRERAALEGLLDSCNVVACTNVGSSARSLAGELHPTYSPEGSL